MAQISLQAAYDQARQALETNDPELAIGLAEHILLAWPDNLEAYRILGEAYLASRQLDQAQDAFERVLRSDPENIPAHVGLGITFERQGRLDRAVPEFEQALEIKPDVPELRSQLLRLYTDAWGSEYAQLRLSRAGLARLYAKGHMLAQAINEFRYVISENPDRFDAKVALAEALWRDGQEDEAADYSRQILAERPEALKPNLILGYLALASGQPEGRAAWAAATRMDPYQAVARSLFDPLPDTASAEPMIEALNEIAWREEKLTQLNATRPIEIPAVAAVADDNATTSWFEKFAPPPVATPVEAGPPSDDFLAGLLAIDSPPLPPPATSTVTSDDLDLDLPPFSLDDIEETPTPPATPVAARDVLVATDDAGPEPEMKPFSFADLGLSEEEINALSDTGSQHQTPPLGLANEPEIVATSAADEAVQQQDLAAPAPASNASDFTPFSLADLGLSDDEIAALDLGDQAAPAVQSQDLAAPAPAAPAPASGEPDFTPFSLADLGLSDDEIAALDSATTSAEPAAPAPAAPAPASDESDFTPFSLTDLGLSDDEIAALDSATTSAEPAAAVPPQAAEPPTSGEPDFTPFSLADLGLSDDEIAALDSATTSAEPAAAVPPQAAEPPTSGEPNFTPFSLADLGLSDDEIAALDLGDQAAPAVQPQDFAAPAPAAPASAVPRQTDMAPSIDDEPELTPFSLDDLGLSDDDLASLDSLQDLDTRPSAGASASQPPKASGTPGSGLELTDLPPDLRPFSLDELELTGSGELSGGLPSSLQPFSIDDSPLERPIRPSAPLDEPLDDLDPSDNDAPPVTGGYSWQQPTQRAKPSFLEGNRPPAENENASIFTKLKQLRENTVLPEEPEKPLAELEPGDIEHTRLFSQDDFSLRDGTSAESLPTTPTPPPAPATPLGSTEPFGFTSGGIEPFSLSDLGLSADEIAALGLGEPIPPVAPPVAAPPTSPEPTAPEPVAPPVAALPASDEPDTTIEADSVSEALATGEVQPFSFADLGLSDEEIAALGLGEPTAPASDRAEAPVPPAEMPAVVPEVATTPPANPDPMPPINEIEDLSQALASGDMQPFSFADLGLSDEEVAALGLGEPAAPPVPEPVAPPPAPMAPPAPLQPPATDDTIEAESVGEALASGEVQPFSFADLGLSDEEVAALGLGEPATPPAPTLVPAAPPPAAEPPVAPAAPPAVEEEPLLTDDLKPFSLTDLGLTDEEMAAFGFDTSEAGTTQRPGLGLSEADLADIGLDNLDWEAPETPAPAASLPPAAKLEEPEPFSFDAAPFEPVTLDQPSSTELPVAPSLSGDPLIDRLMALGREQGYVDISDIIAGVENPEAEADRIEEIGQMLHEAQIQIRDGDEIIDMEAEYEEDEFELPAPTGEADMTPFSLSELGLSDEEIAALDLESPQPEPAPPAAAEPAPTPFSLGDLGLSEDDLATLDTATIEGATFDFGSDDTNSGAPTSSPEADLSPFSLSELGLSEEEIAALNEFSPPAEAAPTAAAATPDIGVPPVIQPAPEPLLPPAPPITPALPPALVPPPAPRPAPTGAPAFTSDLEVFQQQLLANPADHGLRLALARVSAQTGMADVAIQHYKTLIKQGALLDEIVDDLRDLIEDDTNLDNQRRLHRMIGDVYSKQGRVREAIEAYNWTITARGH